MGKFFKLTTNGYKYPKTEGMMGDNAMMLKQITFIFLRYCYLVGVKERYCYLAPIVRIKTKRFPTEWTMLKKAKNVRTQTTFMRNFDFFFFEMPSISRAQAPQIKNNL